MDGSNANGGTIVTSANTPENALAPQKVRTERYVKVSVKGMPVARSKSLFLSWFLDNNGLPDCCLLLIPERHPNVIISFKGTHGWIEIDAAHCKAPDYEIQFELKLHHAFLNRRRYVQNQPIVLRFFLLDKREDGQINNLGEVLLSVLLMSSKCANRTLIAHFIKDDKQRDLSMQIPLNPSLSLAPSDRKSYEIDQDDNQLQVPPTLNNSNNNNSNNNSSNNNNNNLNVAATYAALAHHHHHISPHHYSNHLTMGNNNSNNNPNGNTNNNMSHQQQQHTMTQQQHQQHQQQQQQQLAHSHSHHPMVQHHMGVHSLNPQVLSHPQLLQSQALYAQPIYTGNQN